MAIVKDFDLFPGITIPGAYITVGEVRWNFFHETVEIDVYVWHSETARQEAASTRRDADGKLVRTLPDEVLRPLRKILVQPHFGVYERYLKAELLSGEGMNPQRAVYELLANEPEPFGLAGLLAGSVKHD